MSKKTTTTKKPEAPTSLPRKLIAYRCLIDSDPWFVTWLHDDDILGVMDGKTKLFETQLTTTERKKLAGNVSESLLADKWTKLFETRAFTIEFNGDDEIEVTYVRDSVILKKVEQSNVHERIAEILNHSIAGMMAISKKLAEYEEKAKAQHIRDYAAKRVLYRGEPKSPAKTRRRREQPTGLKFEDDDDDE
jgi:hypothetical protein